MLDPNYESRTWEWIIKWHREVFASILLPGDDDKERIRALKYLRVSKTLIATWKNPNKRAFFEWLNTHDLPE